MTTFVVFQKVSLILKTQRFVIKPIWFVAVTKQALVPTSLLPCTSPSFDGWERVGHFFYSVFLFYFWKVLWELPCSSAPKHAGMLCRECGTCKSGTWWCPLVLCCGYDHEGKCLRVLAPHLRWDSWGRYPAHRIFESKNRNKDEEIPEQLTCCAIFKLFLIIVLPQIII